MREHGLQLPTGSASGAARRHEHGTAYLSDLFQAELKFLGIQEFAVVRARIWVQWLDERFARILKENYGVHPTNGSTVPRLTARADVAISSR